MNNKLLSEFLLRLAKIVHDMKTTGTASLHITDRQTREKLDGLMDDVIAAMEQDSDATSGDCR